MLFLFLKEFANIRILSQLFNSDFKNIFWHGAGRLAQGELLLDLRVLLNFDKKADMPTALNATQLEILKLFRDDQTEEELQEIRSLLIAYLAGKVTFEADKAFKEKG